MTTLRLIIVVGEASGDAHAARVLRALREILGKVEVHGMGGAYLANAGMQVDVDIRRTTGMGGIEVVRRLPQLIGAFQKLRKVSKEFRPQGALLVDSPDFNLPLGRKLRDDGIPVLGYVAPQFWAWRPTRVKQVARCFDKLACILPFEEHDLRIAGVEAHFVGHPSLELPHIERGYARRRLGIEGSGPCIALLPGSRPSEVSYLLAPMVRAYQRLRDRFPGLTAVMAVAPTVDIGNELPPEVVRVDSRTTSEPGRLALAAADAAIVASGTATLEAALLKIPLIAVYRFAPLTFAAARLLVRSRFFALPNIILNRPVIPEVLQHEVCEDILSELVSGLLNVNASAREQREASASLREILAGPGATRTTAELVASMIAP